MKKIKKTINKVELKQDENCEMAILIVNGKPIFEGNYWDFDRFETIKRVCDALNIKFKYSKYKYE